MLWHCWISNWRNFFLVDRDSLDIHHLFKMGSELMNGGSNQKYNLRWHDYPQSVVTSFRHLKEDEDFVDVTLACNSQQFTAHKVVLSACSPYFKKLLKVSWTQNFTFQQPRWCSYYWLVLTKALKRASQQALTLSEFDDLRDS